MSENPYQPSSNSDAISLTELEKTTWKTLVSHGIFFFPSLMLLLNLLVWLVAFVQLGRAPTPHVDDPFTLGPAVSSLSYLVTLATILYPLSVFASFGIAIWLRRWLGVMQSWNKLGLLAIIVVQFSLVQIFFRIDPLKIADWLGD